MWYHTVVLGSALLIPSPLCARMAAQDHRAVDQSHPARTTIIPANRAINRIIYQFPKDGDINVQPGTTLIIRLSKVLAHNNSASDFSFIVNGEQSGEHTGKVVICNDNNTVIFKPENPFALGEKVQVQLTIESLEPIITSSYGFQITSMDEKEQALWLKYFSEKEEKENTAFRSQTFQKKFEPPNIPLDTIPPYFPKITIDANSAGSAPGNIFLTPVGVTGPEKSFAFNTIVDNTGHLQYNRKVPGQGTVAADFKVQETNTITSPIATNGGFYELNSHFNIIDSFKCGNGFIADIHDFELLPNGNAILIAYNPVNTGSSIVEDNIIQILNKDKEVIFQWRALDHFTISDATHEDTSAYAVDFAHINSIQSDTDGNIIASFRHLDEVAKIDHVTGDILWHWGGKHNQFTFIGDTLPFSHQHHARRIANGNITMFDNGNYHSTMFEEEPIVAPSSRAIEYDLDEVNHTATVKWQYKNIPYSNAAGSVQRLANGNTFIGTGNLSSPCAIEVTPKGDIVFQLSLPQLTVSYRAYRFDWSPAAVRIGNSTHDLGFHSIYPNPARSMATILYSADIGPAEIVLTNVLGHTVRSLSQIILKAGENIFDLNVRDLPDGVYYCNLSQNGRISIKAIVVQK